MYKITFKKRAGKELRNLPSPVLKRIVNSIEHLAENPRPEGSKKLKGIDENIWRIRVGDYRIIYLIEDSIQVIEIRKIGHRKDVYL